MSLTSPVPKKKSPAEAGVCDGKSLSRERRESRTGTELMKRKRHDSVRCVKRYENTKLSTLCVRTKYRFVDLLCVQCAMHASITFLNTVAVMNVAKQNENEQQTSYEVQVGGYVLTAYITM